MPVTGLQQVFTLLRSSGLPRLLPDGLLITPQPTLSLRGDPGFSRYLSLLTSIETYSLIRLLLLTLLHDAFFKLNRNTVRKNPLPLLIVHLYALIIERCLDQPKHRGAYLQGVVLLCIHPEIELKLYCRNG